MKKIFIVTAGSRGDVQPYVALGKGLKNAGHKVTLCTCSSFEPFIREHGLEYGYMDNDFIKLVDSEEGRSAMEDSGNFLGLMKVMITLMKDAKRLNRVMMRDAWKAAQETNPDILIYHPKALAGSHIGEKLGIPTFLAVPVPVIVPTSEFTAIGVPDLKLGKGFNKLTHRLVHGGYHNYDDVVNEFRQEVLGLDKYPRSNSPIEKTDGSPIPVLHAHSAHVWPAPHDWPESAYVTGYWFLEQDTDWQPPADLVTFLKSGEPPVYIGFGSMAGRNPEKTTRIVLEALQKAGKRGIIATGWGGMQAEDLLDTVFMIDKVPHDWLFPKVAAVVHHGGAGTTAAGLKAGIPSIICPFLVDQPIWGKRVYDLGVGSKPIPQKKLNAEKLAAAITEVTTNSKIQENARILGEKILEENGISNAIEIIERLSDR